MSRLKPKVSLFSKSVCGINLAAGHRAKHAIDTPEDLLAPDRCVALGWRRTVLCGGAQDKRRLCDAALFCGACSSARLSTPGTEPWFRSILSLKLSDSGSRSYHWLPGSAHSLLTML